MEVLIEDFNHTGEGIGRIDGKIVFVPKTIPGDIVLVGKLKDYKSYYKGEVLKYIKNSDNKVKSICPYYDVCGGCQLMELSYLEQLNYKKNKVKNILKRYSDIDVDLDIILSNKISGYRNKITLQVVNGELGLYKYNSNDLVKIDKCMLVSDEVNNLIGIIRKNLDLMNVEKIMIREYNQDLLVQFIGDINKKDVINVLSGFVKSIYINNNLIYGNSSLEVKLGNYRYVVSPYSFFQVNYEQAEILYDKIKEYLGDNNNKVLDLYCGTGSIGIYVSNCCREVIGIEINESSVKDAKINIELNNLNNISVIKGDVGKVLKSGGEYDAIIVDPPRSGLDKKTKNVLLELKCDKLIYVSCDPITLARDLKVLCDIYDIEDMILVDMFPNTYHVESVVVLRKKYFKGDLCD